MSESPITTATDLAAMVRDEETGEFVDEFHPERRST